MAPPHAQSAWGFREERVRATRLATCCNYFSKKNDILRIIIIIISRKKKKERKKKRNRNLTINFCAIEYFSFVMVCSYVCVCVEREGERERENVIII